MELGKLRLNTPAKNNNLIWKYLDLHRFIYLLTEEKLFFTRLDKFQDPIEGIPTGLLRRNAKYSTIPSSVSDFPESVPESEREKLVNEKKMHEYLMDENIEKNQKCQYVSCWFSGTRESMAMWNIYSNSDSVALKADFKTLKDGLNSSFQDFIVENDNKISIIGESIKYLPLNPFDSKLEKQKLVSSGLKKDESFEYEKEYRFLISSKKNANAQKMFFAIPVDLNSLKLTVVTHPSMEEWKFQNIQKLINKSGKSISLQKSPIILRSKSILNL